MKSATTSPSLGGKPANESPFGSFTTTRLESLITFQIGFHLNAEPAGPVMNALREVLDPWLGKPQWKQSEGRVTFFYRFASEDIPPLRLRLKVEINSREHFSVYGWLHTRTVRCILALV